MDSHTACQLVWWINAGRATLIAEQVAALSIEAAWVTPDASVAVHVTTVVPTKNFGGALFVSLGVPAQSSVAVGTPSAGDPQSRRCRSGGIDVMIGGIVISLYMPLFSMIAKLAG